LTENRGRRPGGPGTKAAPRGEGRVVEKKQRQPASPRGGGGGGGGWTHTHTHGQGEGRDQKQGGEKYRVQYRF